MERPDNCPNCGVTWIDEPIPMDIRHSYGSRTHFRREIAIYDRDLDCTIAWECPDCRYQLARDAGEIARVAEIIPPKID